MIVGYNFAFMSLSYSYSDNIYWTLIRTIWTGHNCSWTQRDKCDVGWTLNKHGEYNTRRLEVEGGRERGRKRKKRVFNLSSRNVFNLYLDFDMDVALGRI